MAPLGELAAAVAPKFPTARSTDAVSCHLECGQTSQGLFTLLCCMVGVSASHSGRQPCMDIPSDLPSPAELASIIDTLALLVRDLDKRSRQVQYQRQKARYQQNANQVFKDVRAAGPCPVDALLDQTVVGVESAPDEDSIIIPTTAHLDPDKVVYGDATPLRILIMDTDQVWFTTTHTLRPGMRLRQTEPIAQLDQIFSRFQDEWQHRWDRHRHIPDSEWSHILGFIDAAVPTGSMQWPALTPETWDGEVRRKNRKTASGMDGVSKEDLENLAAPATAQLVQLLQRVETDGLWPDSMLHGAVHSLQKVRDAALPGQYRPITILSLTYRIWSGLRSKQLMDHLFNVLPSSLMGSIRGRCSATMWIQMQWLIEASQWDETTLAGASVDIIKCFNTLPRLPLMTTAIKLGAPDTLIKPWMSFLTSLERHFIVRACAGPGLTSATGFAEGDSLSVSAMILCNLLVHTYQQVSAPSVHLWSYVDNWDLLSSDVPALVDSIRRVDAFSQLLDIAVNKDKTVVWAVQPSSRKELRQEQVVTHNYRELGGHLQTTKKRTNSTLRHKCEDLPEVWRKLRRSPAPRAIKHRVLRCKAWPSALHSSPIVAVSDTILNTMRAGAVRALGLSKGGTDSHLYLGLCIHPAHDPEGYVILTAMRAFRRQFNLQMIAPYLDRIGSCPDQRRFPGPLGLWFGRLEALGWQHLQDMQWVDHEGVMIDVCHCSIQELRTRVLHGFQQRVGAKHAHRHGFAGLQDVGPWLSNRALLKKPCEDIGLIRALQMGTFITADQLGTAHHVEETARNCKFCGRPECLQHRRWECAGTSHLRGSLSTLCREWIQSQPECDTHRGWAVQPESVITFRKALSLIPDTSSMFVQPEVHDHIFAFTDGSGLDPTVPATRLVGWAWCLATEPFGPFVPIAKGGLPGWYQTVVRAELLSVISVMKYCNQMGVSAFIFSDNLFVVNRANAVFATSAVDPIATDWDLWQIFADEAELLRMSSRRVELCHVRSHREGENLPELDQWICQGNEMADRLAGDALLSLPSEVTAAQAKASADYATTMKHHRALLEYFAKVGHLSVQTPDPTRPEPLPWPVAPEVRALDVQAVVDHAQQGLPRHLQWEGVTEWITWFSSITAPDLPIIWTSWLELLIHFQQTVRIKGVWNIMVAGNRQWSRVPQHQDVGMRKLMKSFSAFGTSLIRHFDPEWRAVQKQPAFFGLSVWTSCLPIRLKPDVHRVVVDWWKAHHVKRISSSTQFGSIPIAF